MNPVMTGYPHSTSLQLVHYQSPSATSDLHQLRNSNTTPAPIHLLQDLTPPIPKETGGDLRAYLPRLPTHEECGDGRRGNGAVA